jgi:hypothetical protein
VQPGKWPYEEKLGISKAILGQVKLRLAICDSNADKSPDPRHVELLDLDLEDRLSTSLAKHELIKDTPFAAQYASGLPNNARIVVVLPAPTAPATAPVPGEYCHILKPTKYSASCTYRSVANLFPLSLLLLVIPYLSTSPHHRRQSLVVLGVLRLFLESAWGK